MKRQIKKIKGFTLVELIIVITILIILGSIAFVSFQGYTKNSRDSSRLSTISTIHKGISLNQATTGKAVLPDDYTQVSASGYLMGYEGIVGENVGRVIGLNSVPKDPKTDINYIYYTNAERNKAQVMGFLEGEEMVYLGINKANATGTGTKIPKVTGDNLGIILDENYDRLTGEQVDILGSNSGVTYITYFSDIDTVTSIGGELFSNIYNRRSDLLSDARLVSFDNTLVGYFDMETLTGGKLKDLSKYGNHGTLYGGVVVGGIDGIKGKTTYFDGVDDYISFNSGGIIGAGSGITLVVWTSPSTQISGYYNFHKDIIRSNNSILGISTGGQFNTTPAIQFLLNWIKYDQNGTWFYNESKYLLNMENWNNIIYSQDKKSGKVKVFINGVKYIDENVSVNGTGVINTMFIGASTAGTYRGAIDEIKIYNRGLSDAEALELYNSVK